MDSLNNEGVIFLKQGERTFQFKKNYVKMHEKGMSVLEIADYYNLSHSYAYRLIRKIAVEIGVPYESLLDHPHSTYVSMGRNDSIRRVQRRDYSGFEKESRDEAIELDNVLRQMDETISGWPVMPADIADFGEVNNER